MNKDETIKELEKLRDFKEYSQSELLNTGYRTAILDAIDLVKKMNYIPCCTEFICHSCNEKKSGQNDDQLHEVCKECFGSI